MAQIKVLDLDNACSLSELSGEEINSVKGGYLGVLAATKNQALANSISLYVLSRTGSVVAARAASLSTRA